MWQYLLQVLAGVLLVHAVIPVKESLVTFLEPLLVALVILQFLFRVRRTHDLLSHGYRA